MMAELFGKYEGYNHGKGGSMHIADVEHGMLGATGIVGSGMPLAVGAAMAPTSWKRGQCPSVSTGTAVPTRVSGMNQLTWPQPGSCS